LFLELARQALNDKDMNDATRFSLKALDLHLASAEIWKIVSAIKHEQDSSAGLTMLLKGANESSMPIKQRIELCRMVTLKDPDHLQARFLSFELNQLKTQDKLKRVKIEVQWLKEKIIQSIAFGKVKWETYFGEIGEEPPLPSNIHQILAAPCPFWPNKKVEETHMLVLIPKTVNGQLLTLNTLAELVKSPKQGNATKLWILDSVAGSGYENPSITNSYWVLMTRDILEGTRNKSYDDQMQIVCTFRQKIGVDYQVPKLLEAAVCIFMEYVSKGTRIYSDNPFTITRCQEEKFEDTKYQQPVNTHAIIGNFGADHGLAVGFHPVGPNAWHGLACLRKL